MDIAVYSGSFNPLHIGHLAIMRHLTEVDGYDAVYLVVSPKNPLKEGISAATGQERFEAACAAVRRHPGLRVHVDRIELEMAPPHYSIRTLDALKQREKENDFTLVIGADNLEDIHRWRDFQRLLSDYGVAVFPRAGYDLKRIAADLLEECRRFPSPYVLDASQTESANLEETLARAYHIRLIDAPLVDISSTQIREGIARGEDMSAWLM